MNMKGTLALAAVLSIGLLGCQNTAEGVQEDTEHNAEKAAQATDNAMEGAAEATADVSAATTLTPAVKTAITAEPKLNEAENLINVDSTAETVTLSGHVTSEALKQLAQQVAERVIKERNGGQKVDNQLQVQPADTSSTNDGASSNGAGTNR